MEQLHESHYVIKVTRKIVHFSAEFKLKYWEAYCSGATPREIVARLGINPEILGMNRINGLKNKIWDDIKAGKGFRDIITSCKHLDSNVSTEVKIKHLEHQLAYKDQEIEFLKKIVSLGRAGTES
jgi:transposase-like protein